MTKEEIFKLIEIAQKIPNSKIHFGIETGNNEICLSFIDSLTLDIIQENMQNKTYEEAIKIIEAYQTLSSN